MSGKDSILLRYFWTFCADCGRDVLRPNGDMGTRCHDCQTKADRAELERLRAEMRQTGAEGSGRV